MGRSASSERAFLLQRVWSWPLPLVQRFKCWRLKQFPTSDVENVILGERQKGGPQFAPHRDGALRDTAKLQEGTNLFWTCCLWTSYSYWKLIFKLSVATLHYLRPVGLKQDDFASQGTLSSIWKHFWLSQLAMEGSATNSYTQGQDFCGTSYSARAAPRDKELSGAKMSTAPRLRSPGTVIHALLLLAFFPLLI